MAMPQDRTHRLAGWLRRAAVIASSSSLAAGALLVSLATSASASHLATGNYPAPGRCVCSTARAALDGGRSVTLYNLSSYPEARVKDLTLWADRGMATRTPLTTARAGLMHTGDQVIATNYGLYWIDKVHRGGLLGGEWGIDLDQTGQANFSYLVGAHNWGPNLLLPGSNGTATDPLHNAEAGLGVRLLPAGGSDPANTYNIQFAASTETHANLVQGHDHLFQFTGQMVSNNIAAGAHPATAVRYVLTYRFRDANDTAKDENGTLQQQRDRIELSLTPSRAMKLSILDIGSDLQYIPAVGNPAGNQTKTPQAESLRMKTTTAARYTVGHYGPTCGGPASIASNAWGVLCRGALNFLQGTEKLPKRMSAGDSTDYCSAGCARALATIHPAGFTMPARDEVVYDTSNGVIACETQFFNGDGIQSWPAGVTHMYAIDQQLKQY